jgi:hypothetical protein
LTDPFQADLDAATFELQRCLAAAGWRVEALAVGVVVAPPGDSEQRVRGFVGIAPEGGKVPVAIDLCRAAAAALEAATEDAAALEAVEEAKRKRPG